LGAGKSDCSTAFQRWTGQTGPVILPTHFAGQPREHMIGFCSSTRFTDHDTGPSHPERPERITAIMRAVEESGLALEHIEPSRAHEVCLSYIHTPYHIDFVRRICAAGWGSLDAGDTPVCSESYDTALLAVGGVLQCCDAVMLGRVQRAFAAVRPPGHHAEPGRSLGFCLFNSIAIAARYLQKQYGLERVAIVDFDVHHGNGTQAAFFSDPTVYYASLHQDGLTLFPGTGFDWEMGIGEGTGHNLNIPLPPGTGDAEYLQAIETRIVPALEQYRPQFLLLSAGFDAHKDDPLAQFELTDDCFERLTRTLVAVADRHCQGRTVSVLEGGYNLDALGRCVVRHLQGMGADA
jgi:acetoin utilization deacetylase AcuC-like enzyme